MSTALPGYEEAAALVAAYAAQLGWSQPAAERVQLGTARGRVLAHPVRADSDQPPFARSTRDGYACRAAEASAHQRLAIAGATRAGEAPAGPLPPLAAWEIMTGAPVPEGADAVMMLEHVEAESGHVRLVPPRAVTVSENIVAQGAQALAGDELLPTGSMMGFAQIALAASCGCAELEVFVKPRVAILATGDEIVPVEAAPASGQIRNSNGPMLAALVAAAGGKPWILPAARDTAEALDEALALAADADLLLVTGGVSAGKFDLVEPALARLNARFHFTGVRIQPGKPLVFGDLPANNAEIRRSETRQAGTRQKAGRRQCFFGLPGNPISSAVTFLLFAEPILAALSGRLNSGPRFALAQLTTDVKRKPGLTRFLPASCTFGATGALPKVGPVEWQGSGDLAAMAHSNCFLVVPEEASPTEAGPAEDSGQLRTGATVRILLP